MLQAQLPESEFRNISDGFMVRVFAEKIKVIKKVGEVLTKNQELILQFITENNRISAKEPAEKIDISHRKTEKNI